MNSFFQAKMANISWFQFPRFDAFLILHLTEYLCVSDCWLMSTKTGILNISPWDLGNYSELFSLFSSS